MSRFILIAGMLLLLLSSCTKEESTQPPTTPEPPNAPSNLTAEAVSFNRISLAWRDNSIDEEGFIIERATGDGAFSRHSNVDSGFVNYFDTLNVVERTRYRYRLYAHRSNLLSAPSNEVSVVTPIHPPAGPSIIRLEALSATRVRILWQDNSPDETGFRVMRAQGGATGFTTIAQTASNVTEYTDFNLIEATSYRYKVLAIKDTVEGGVSQTLEIVTPPEIATDLVAESLSDTSIRIGWRDNSQSEIGFRIERLNQNGDNWDSLTTNNTNNTHFIDIGLSEWTRYSYRVVTLGDLSESEPCDIASATTGLKSPSDLRAGRSSETSIELIWNDRSNAEEGFEIERADLPSRVFRRLVQIPPNLTSYTNVGLNPNSSYTYRIRCAREGRYSEWSNEATGTTTILRPPAPTDLLAVTTNTLEITLTWSDNSVNEDGFVVQWKRLTGIDWDFTDSVSAGVNICRPIMENWRTTYQFRVYAYNEHGNSGYSNIAQATTPNGPPGAPSDLVGSVQDFSAVHLSWRDNSINEDEFRLYRKIDGNWDLLVILPENAISYIDRNIEPARRYIYRVQAANESGYSPFSNELEINVPDAIPEAPSNLRASPTGANSVLLIWQDNSEYETGFTLARKLFPDGEWENVHDNQLNDTAYVDSELQQSTNYAYRVQAFTIVGHDEYRSDWSNEATVRTLPNAPSHLVATGMPMAVRLNWQDNSNYEDEFIIERRKSGENNFRVVNRTIGDLTTFLDAGLDAESWYVYRVKAVEQGVQSVYSNVDSALTQNAIVFFDNFEDYEIGQPPAGDWEVITEGTSWIRVTDETSHPEDGKSVRFSDPDEGDNLAIMYVITPLMTRGTLRLFLKLENYGRMGISGGDPGRVTTFDVIVDEDGMITAWNGVQRSELVEYPLDEWMELEIVFSMQTQSYNVYLNGEEIGSDLAFQRQNHQGNLYLNIQTFAETEISTFWIDEISLGSQLAHRAPRPSPLRSGLHNDSRQITDIKSPK